MTFLLVSCYCFKVTIRCPFHQVNIYWWQHVHFPCLLLLMQNPGVLLLCKFPSSHTCLALCPSHQAHSCLRSFIPDASAPALCLRNSSALPHSLHGSVQTPPWLCSLVSGFPASFFFTQSWFLGGLAFFFCHLVIGMHLVVIFSGNTYRWHIYWKHAYIYDFHICIYIYIYGILIIYKSLLVAFKRQRGCINHSSITTEMCPPSSGLWFYPEDWS